MPCFAGYNAASSGEEITSSKRGDICGAWRTAHPRISARNGASHAFRACRTDLVRRRYVQRDTPHPCETATCGRPGNLWSNAGSASDRRGRSKHVVGPHTEALDVWQDADRVARRRWIGAWVASICAFCDPRPGAEPVHRSGVWCFADSPVYTYSASKRRLTYWPQAGDVCSHTSVRAIERDWPGQPERVVHRGREASHPGWPLVHGSHLLYRRRQRSQRRSVILDAIVSRETSSPDYPCGVYQEKVMGMSGR